MRNMLRIIPAAIIFVLSFLQATSQNCLPLAGEVYYLKSKTLNLRAEPSLKSDILTVLNDEHYSLVVIHEDSIYNNYILVKAVKDTFNTTLEESVRVEEKIGWVSCDFVNFNGDNMNYFLRSFGKAREADVRKIIMEEEELRSSSSCRYNPTRLSYAYSQLGINLFDSENYIEAIKQFNTSIQLATYNSLEHKLVSIFYRAKCKMNLGDFYGAIQDLNIIKYHKTTKIGSLLVIGWRFKSEIDALKLTGSTIPIIDMERVLLSLAICKAELKRYPEALTDINTVIVNNKNSGNAYYIRAHIYFAQNLKEKSCKEASKAGELGIDDAYEFISENCK